MRVAGMEVLDKELVYVDCRLKEVVWMARESLQQFLCLHWYILHRLSSKGFLGKFHLCD